MFKQEIKDGFQLEGPDNWLKMCIRDRSLEVDQAELKQLVLQGSNLYFEELACGREDLTFQELSNKLMEKMDISVVSEDILRLSLIHI